MCICSTKAFEINQVFSCFEIKKNNTTFSVLSFNKALKLHICLKSTVATNLTKIAQMHFHSTKAFTLKIKNPKYNVVKRKTSMIHIKIKN
jgi:hypothetical protein